MADDLYRFGPLAVRLTVRELMVITEASGSQPWAILGWSSQVLPEVMYVDAFLPPKVSYGRLKRGRFCHLECRPTAGHGDCVNWKRAGELGSYVHIQDVAGKSNSPQPIRVRGEWSDEDLLTIVDFVRSNPSSQEAQGEAGWRISPGLPIQDIVKEASGMVWVRLSTGGAYGETARLERTPRGWRLTSVVGTVASRAKAPHNNELQRTRPGFAWASPLNSVLDRQEEERR